MPLRVAPRSTDRTLRLEIPLNDIFVYKSFILELCFVVSSIMDMYICILIIWE